MARLLPSNLRPDLREPERALVSALERQLDSSYIVFQPSPLRGTVLAHPEEGIFVISCKSDLNGEEDVEMLATSAVARLTSLIERVPECVTGLIFVPNLPKAAQGPVLVGGDGDAAIAHSVVAAMRHAKHGRILGVAGIEYLMRSLAPSSVPAAPPTEESKRPWTIEDCRCVVRAVEDATEIAMVIPWAYRNPDSEVIEAHPAMMTAMGISIARPFSVVGKVTIKLQRRKLTDEGMFDILDDATRMGARDFLRWIGLIDDKLKNPKSMYVDAQHALTAIKGIDLAKARAWIESEVLRHLRPLIDDEALAVIASWHRVVRVLESPAGDSGPDRGSMH